MTLSFIHSKDNINLKKAYLISLHHESNNDYVIVNINDDDLDKLFVFWLPDHTILTEVPTTDKAYFLSENGE